MGQFKEEKLRNHDDTPKFLIDLKVGKDKKIGDNKNKNVSFYGVEIELERKNIPVKKTRQKIVVHVTSKINTEKFRFIGKHDGSMMSGIEFVSNPMSISAWTYNWRRIRKFFKVTSDLLSPSQTAGLHIHLAHNSLDGVPHIKRIIEFVYKNADFFIKMSGRTDQYRLNKYASFEMLSKIWLPEDTLIERVLRTRDETYKYGAIRLTRNTLEFRFFCSTSNWEVFLGRLQVIDILKNWCSISKSNNVEEMLNWARPIQEKWLKNIWKYGISCIEKTLLIKENPLIVKQKASFKITDIPQSSSTTEAYDSLLARLVVSTDAWMQPGSVIQVPDNLTFYTSNYGTSTEIVQGHFNEVPLTIERS
jgi:hypothetical protein